MNRNYKPVGFLTEKWVGYAEYLIGFRFKHLEERTIRKLSIVERSDGDIYLCDDGSIPTRGKRNMKAYLEKLAILMKLEIF